MAYQNETTDRNVYEEMGDNRQPPSVYANVNSTPTRRASPLDKGVSRRALLIGLLVPTLVALGAVCGVVALEYTQQARLEESVKDLVVQVESLDSIMVSFRTQLASIQRPQNDDKDIQLPKIDGQLLQNLSTQVVSQEAALLELKAQVQILLNITNQVDCRDQPCANGGTCVNGTGPEILTLEEHMRQITASRTFTGPHGHTFPPSNAVDQDPGTYWRPENSDSTAWIQVDFSFVQQVFRVDVMLKCQDRYQPSAYRVTFSDGSTQEVSKPCAPTCPRPSGVKYSRDDQTVYTLSLHPTRTTSLHLQPTAYCDHPYPIYELFELVIWGF